MEVRGTRDKKKGNCIKKPKPWIYCKTSCRPSSLCCCRLSDWKPNQHGSWKKGHVAMWPWWLITNHIHTLEVHTQICWPWFARYIPNTKAPVRYTALLYPDVKLYPPNSEGSCWTASALRHIWIVPGNSRNIQCISHEVMVSLKHITQRLAALRFTLFLVLFNPLESEHISLIVT